MIAPDPFSPQRITWAASFRATRKKHALVFEQMSFLCSVLNSDHFPPVPFRINSFFYDFKVYLSVAVSCKTCFFLTLLVRIDSSSVLVPSTTSPSPSPVDFFTPLVSAKRVRIENLPSLLYIFFCSVFFLFCQGLTNSHRAVCPFYCWSSLP